MFGMLLKELELTVEFKEKEVILEKAQEVNSIRIHNQHTVSVKTDDMEKELIVPVKSIGYGSRIYKGYET
jgi:hypothetical protein